MKRAEFLQLWSDIIREGRTRNFPDMRPSEHAMSVINDQKMALGHWRKYGQHFRSLSVAEARDIIQHLEVTSS